MSLSLHQQKETIVQQIDCSEEEYESESGEITIAEENGIERGENGTCDDVFVAVDAFVL